MHIEEMTSKQLWEVFINREDALESIDIKALADVLVECSNNLDCFGKETLVEALKNKEGVNHISSEYGYRDYGMYVECGEVRHGTGKVTLLAVEGLD